MNLQWFSAVSSYFCVWGQVVFGSADLGWACSHNLDWLALGRSRMALADLGWQGLWCPCLLSYRRLIQVCLHDSGRGKGEKALIPKPI
jgi:hypothetical protein